MKKIISLTISSMPFNVVRIFFFRLLFGYKIDFKSKIGMFNVILANEFKMNNAKIGKFNYIDAQSVIIEKGGLINKFNRIKHLNRFILDEKSIIFSWNFIGGSRDAENKKNQNLIVGNNSDILRNNYFDATNEIVIGKNVVFGGNGSEIWTHGFDTDRKMLTGKVIFENDIFIGSKCIFTKDIKITSNTTIGPGSVVYKNIEESGLYSSQQLVKIK
jgi:acetyltransferase-like isoleucine patch superfamily enzyme